MCGIAGFVGRGTLDDLQRMTEALAHRGPDGSGRWVDEQRGVYLGHRRLSIVDLTGGAQPMQTGDRRLVVTYNGEIYNHRDLRRELESSGHRFQTDHSDTEVLLYGYREWGAGLLDRLNGMWAFALYDREKDELFCSRDRFGKKPFFYTNVQGTFAFASELIALQQHSKTSRSLNPAGLQKYFAHGFIPAPQTAVRDVFKLPAGHWLKITAGATNVQPKRYWQYKLEPFTSAPKNPGREWGDELLSRLRTAVRRRLEADVPVGVFLSGGIDSTVIATLATETHPRIESFNIGFEEKSFDERAYARLAAQSAGTSHQEEILAIDRCLDLAYGVARRLDDIIGDASFLPTSMVARLARQKVTVALSGDGSDELLAGYDPFRILNLAHSYGRFMPPGAHRILSGLASRVPVSLTNMSLDFKAKRFLRGLSYPKSMQLPIWMAPLTPPEIETLFGSQVDPEDLYSEAITAWNDSSAKTDLDRATQFYVQLYLQDDILVKTDRASMLHGLEVRAPFLDIDVVDFVRRIPSGYKLRRGISKYLLREGARRLIPKAIIDRPKKGFGVPTGRWFKEGKIKLEVDALPKTLNHRWIVQRLAEHQKGVRDDRAMLWSAWTLLNSAVEARG
jgi:asparagine synthase (glutamine-hydrolysing)